MLPTQQGVCVAGCRPDFQPLLSRESLSDPRIALAGGQSVITTSLLVQFWYPAFTVLWLSGLHRPVRRHVTAYSKEARFDHQTVPPDGRRPFLSVLTALICAGRFFRRYREQQRWR